MTTNFRDRRNSPGAYQFPYAASRRIFILDLIGNHLLQVRVLLLQRLQLFGHCRLHATVLLTPVIVGLHGDLQSPTGLFDGVLSLAQFPIGLTQLADDLVHAVTFTGDLENLISGSSRSG